MRTVFEQVIGRGEFDLAGLLKNIDTYHVEGKLTDADRDALYEYARRKAVPQYDSADEISRLWAAVTELQDAVASLRNSTVTDEQEQQDEPADEWPEWVQPLGAHDAYRAGDKVTYRGARYVCTMLTVYAPDVYPAAWNLHTEVA